MSASPARRICQADCTSIELGRARLPKADGDSLDVTLVGVGGVLRYARDEVSRGATARGRDGAAPLADNSGAHARASNRAQRWFVLCNGWSDGGTDESIPSDGRVCIGPDARDERQGAGPATSWNGRPGPGAIGAAGVCPGPVSGAQAPPAEPPPGAAPQSQAPANPAQAEPTVAPAPPVTAEMASQGEWVYTAQYGWTWVPYGSTTTTVSEEPYVYLYAPSFGWRGSYRLGARALPLRSVGVGTSVGTPLLAARLGRGTHAPYVRRGAVHFAPRAYAPRAYGAVRVYGGGAHVAGAARVGGFHGFGGFHGGGGHHR